MNKPGILLEVVQVLSDLDLAISKAYITSDGTWFMDGMLMIQSTTIFVNFLQVDVLNFLWILNESVFHVTDQQGRKITEKKTIDYIEKVTSVLIF